MTQRFLCDQMLKRLGRWLRAAGYDTAIIELPLKDEQVLQCAYDEDRLLITRDRHFLLMKNQERILFLSGNTVEDCVEELTKKAGINWLLHPLTRCLICNSPLSEQLPESVLTSVPKDVRETTNAFKYCEHCQKAYWQGSHIKRMLKKLQDFQDKDKKTG